MYNKENVSPKASLWHFYAKRSQGMWFPNGQGEKVVKLRVAAINDANVS